VWRVSGLGALAAAADDFMLLLLFWIAAPQGWTGVQTALVVLALRLPTLGSGLAVGRAVDRWGGRRVAVADLAARIVLLAVLLGCGLAAGEVPLVPVIVLGALMGAASPATYVAVRWSVPRLVAAPRLGRANVVVGFGEQLPLVVSGALVGPSLALLGPVGSLAVPAAMLAVALTQVHRLPAATSRPVAVDAVTAAEPAAPDGGRRRLPARARALIALSVVYYAAYGPFETGTPGFVRDRLHADHGTYGLLWALFGLGATLSLPAAAALARRRPGLVNAAGAALWGLVMLPVVALDGTLAVAVVFLVGGAVWGPYAAVEASALQRWVHPSRHGTTFGLQRGLLRTAAPAGAALGAIALQHVPAHAVLGLSAAACLLAGALALLQRDLRRGR
jgi:MFS family permease